MVVRREEEVLDREQPEKEEPELSLTASLSAGWAVYPPAPSGVGLVGLVGPVGLVEETVGGRGSTNPTNLTNPTNPTGRAGSQNLKRIAANSALSPFLIELDTTLVL